MRVVKLILLLAVVVILVICAIFATIPRVVEKEDKIRIDSINIHNKNGK